MKRYGDVIQVRPEKVEEYKRLHAAVWPEVAAMLRECHIRNYSIYLRRLADGNLYLFGYFEYEGDDFAADMARIGADPVSRQWEDICMKCHVPLADRKEGEWWASMEEVFHQD
jgi:L-rhamnose mutarotase